VSCLTFPLPLELAMRPHKLLCINTERQSWCTSPRTRKPPIKYALAVVPVSQGGNVDWTPWEAEVTVYRSAGDGSDEPYACDTNQVQIWRGPLGGGVKRVEFAFFNADDYVIRVGAKGDPSIEPWTSDLFRVGSYGTKNHSPPRKLFRGTVTHKRLRQPISEASATRLPLFFPFEPHLSGRSRSASAYSAMEAFRLFLHEGAARPLGAIRPDHSHSLLRATLQGV
jgi:hypothetical protein